MFVDKIIYQNQPLCQAVYNEDQELYRVPTTQEIIDAYKDEYLCFTAMENMATLQLKRTKMSGNFDCQLSNDGINWWTYTEDDDPTYSDYFWYYEIQVVKNVKIYFRWHTLNPYNYENFNMWFIGSGKWNISGNINKSIPKLVFEPTSLVADNKKPYLFQGTNRAGQTANISPWNTKYLILPYTTDTTGTQYPRSRYDNLFSTTQKNNMKSTPTYWLNN